MYNVEDYPLNWIDGTYYSTYKGNTFQVPSLENAKSEAEYSAVTAIDLNTQNLTTDFTDVMLSKFTSLTDLRCNDNQIAILDVTNLTSLERLYCHDNQIAILDVTNLTSLEILYCLDNSISTLDVTNLTSLTLLYCWNNSISTLDVTNLTSLTDLFCWNNSISILDVANLTSLTDLRCHVNQLDNLANSQILIDLDNNGLSNGYFQSSIFGGGSLTAAGQTAKINLLSKGWTIVGI